VIGGLVFGNNEMHSCDLAYFVLENRKLLIGAVFIRFEITMSV
jgi:hypothetical protein